MIKQKEFEVGGKTLTLETGKIARQAHGSVTLRCGDTMVFAACCGTEYSKEVRDFFPLTVDFRENYSAGGRFPGGFIKREGKQSIRETLVSRMIDRPMRPMFDNGYVGETQINVATLSYDGEHSSDILAMIAGAASAYLSPVPFSHAMGSVRIGLIDGSLVINPSFEERKKSDLDLIVSGTKDSIAMVEAGANFVSEAVMVDALELAQQEIRKICLALEAFYGELNLVKWSVTPEERDEAIYNSLKAAMQEQLIPALTTEGKKNAEKAVSQLKEALLSPYESDENGKAKASRYFSELKEELFRGYTLHQRQRVDGRGLDEVRPIWGETSLLPRVHGSSLFTRGETQALVSMTLGTESDSQMLDNLDGESAQRFMLHYNFPGYSVGEVKPNRGPGRREIGHGALAERALLPVVPGREQFPYVIRLVSDITESNGSSSMASVCGGCLAMMDGGVPVAHPVAGVAMGLIKEGEAFVVLTDIQGAEDHYGDMDFKVAGSAEGITALQMDIKIQGLTREIMAQALEQAKQGRLHILGEMAKILAEPRPELSDFAPKLEKLKVPVDKIRDVIGPGGKVIRSIIEKTGAKIDIEDSGHCTIFAANGEMAKQARQMVEDLIAVPEVGKTYRGRVSRIETYGAFVQILPGYDGLLHISEVANYRIRKVEDEISLGEEIMVKVIAMEGDRCKLSRRALLE
jgi:polyribonucleotide nucleotidyltransferase